jgi:FMN phosphatase YigB (HAD superfamily)
MRQGEGELDCPLPGVTVVLDAMGVIYSVGEDVVDLLCPFIAERGGESDRSRVASLYREASLGRLAAAEFWRAVHLDPAVEDSYLDLHRLSPGLLEFLRTPPPEVSRLWCLSNDVSEWSRKLRERFGLGRFINGFVISGDVGFRKPDAGIFCRLFNQAAIHPSQAVMVDDREPNLDSAKRLGMRTILFAPGGSMPTPPHAVATDFRQLWHLVSTSGSTGPAT